VAQTRAASITLGFNQPDLSGTTLLYAQGMAAEIGVELHNVTSNAPLQCRN
jgi:hypothetical protein